MLWIGIHLPELGLEIFKQRFPETPNKPAVLAFNNTISIIDQRAREHGIQVGSSLATAHSLTTNLIHFNRDEDAERQRLRQLAGITYRYTPMVSISPPDGLLLEVMGSLKLFGGLGRLNKRLRHLFQQLGHRALLGIAHTPLAALVLAKSNSKIDLPDLPDKIMIQNITEHCLRDVSLAHAEIEPATTERLANMGIFNLGVLLALPSHEIGKRFGIDLLAYLDKLTGKTADPRQPETPDEQFQSSLHLLQPVLDKETLLFPMQRLARELQGWLKARQLGVTELQWQFQPLSGKSLTSPVNFAAPRSNAKSILEISRLTLEITALPTEVLTVVLRATMTEPLSNNPTTLHNLFRGPTSQGASTPTDLIDKISTRLGRQALQAIRAIEDHRPEHAWSPNPPTDPLRTSRPPKTTVDQSLIRRGRRPLWLLEPPEPVNASHFVFLIGPERIEAGWWERDVARDYFVGKDRDGAYCWLFMEEKGCFLHGYFS